MPSWSDTGMITVATFSTRLLVLVLLMASSWWLLSHLLRPPGARIIIARAGAQGRRGEERVAATPATSTRASASASPVAVAPLAVWLLITDRAALWSPLGDCTAFAELEKAIAPTRTRLGSWSMNVLAARSAAASLVGWTSLAAIEPDSSLT